MIQVVKIIDFLYFKVYVIIQPVFIPVSPYVHIFKSKLAVSSKRIEES